MMAHHHGLETLGVEHVDDEEVTGEAGGKVPLGQQTTTLSPTHLVGTNKTARNTWITINLSRESGGSRAGRS